MFLCRGAIIPPTGEISYSDDDTNPPPHAGVCAVGPRQLGAGQPAVRPACCQDRGAAALAEERQTVADNHAADSGSRSHLLTHRTGLFISGNMVPAPAPHPRAVEMPKIGR